MNGCFITSDRLVQPLAVHQFFRGRPMSWFLEQIGLAMWAWERRYTGRCGRLVDCCIHPGRVALVAHHQHTAAIAARPQAQRSRATDSAEPNVKQSRRWRTRTIDHGVLSHSLQAFIGSGQLRMDWKSSDKSLAFHHQTNFRSRRMMTTLPLLTTDISNPATEVDGKHFAVAFALPICVLSRDPLVIRFIDQQDQSCRIRLVEHPMLSWPVGLVFGVRQQVSQARSVSAPLAINKSCWGSESILPKLFDDLRQFGRLCFGAARCFARRSWRCRPARDIWSSGMQIGRVNAREVDSPSCFERWFCQQVTDRQCQEHDHPTEAQLSAATLQQLLEYASDLLGIVGHGALDYSDWHLTCYRSDCGWISIRTAGFQAPTTWEDPVENRLMLLAWLLTAVSLTLLCPPIKGEVVGLTRVATGFDLPLFVTHAPGDADNLFVVEQEGLIRVFNRHTGTIASTPLLDIESLVEHGGHEQGLLGLAFHPDFATNGRFYVNYTTPPGAGADRTRVDEFTVANPAVNLVADPDSRKPILNFAQDSSNHNGGWLGFSPKDGMLYIATGDGGGSNDPNNRGQSLNTRLGKMLRIDVDEDDISGGDEFYGIPSGNPFANDGNANTLAEIWAYGLRNPWRSSFDRVTGDLWIGDVGQGAREEINFQLEGEGGANYGWRLREGNIATPGVGGAEPPGYVGPVYDYLSNGQGAFGGNSVVGGYVYRGPDPEVNGRYFFGDTINNHIWSFYPDGDDPGTTVDQLMNLDALLTPNVGSRNTITSFGEDFYGNLYVVAQGGDIFRIDTDATIPGDYNGDRIVDTADYDVWRLDFGSIESLAADGNGDGVVNLADYTVWRDNLGAELGVGGLLAPGSIPEPRGIVVVMLGLGLAIGIRLRSLLA